MVFLDWVRDNWFTLLQSLGIIGGFIFTGLSLRIDTKVRRVSNRFEATKQHREIWTLLFSRTDLKRVMDKDADLAAKGVTHEEKLFVNLLLLHLESNYRAAEAGMFTLPSELRADIKAFLACPIPRTVWDTMKSLQDKDFAAFVEKHRASEP